MNNIKCMFFIFQGYDIKKKIYKGDVVMKKVLLAVNPTAGNEEAGDFKDRLIEKLNTYFETVDAQMTEYEGHIAELAHKACEEKYDAFFVMGGDGTVSEAISGLSEQDYKPIFGFIPMGTVNDLARALNMPLDPEICIENLVLDSLVKLDVGKVNDKYFSNMVAIGALPRSVKDTSIEDKSKFGKFAYVINGIKELKESTPSRYKLNVDGREFEIESSLIAISVSGAMSSFGNFFKNISPDSKNLALLYTKDQSVFDMLLSLPEAIDGVDGESERIGYQEFTNAKIELIGDGDNQTTIDGDEGPKLPLDISILAHHLDVFVSKEEE